MIEFIAGIIVGVYFMWLVMRVKARRRAEELHEVYHMVDQLRTNRWMRGQAE